MGFIHIVTSMLVNGSFFCSSFFSIIQILQFVHLFFSLLTTVFYLQKGPRSKFQPGAPHNLNPPLVVALYQCTRLITISIVFA